MFNKIIKTISKCRRANLGGAVFYCDLPVKGCVIAGIKRAEPPNITKPRCKRNACFRQLLSENYTILFTC